MTERKPAGLSWESWIDRQVREAQERGEFDNLPGAGKPIPDLRKPYDELWWCKQLIKREQLEGLVPGVMGLKRDIEQEIERVWRQPSEAAVRRIVAELNVRIAKANSETTSGPASDLGLIPSVDVVAEWKKRRGK